MQKLELQLAENLEFSLETNNKELIDSSFFAYKTYVFSMGKYKIEYNWRLFQSLTKKYGDYVINSQKSTNSLKS